MSDLDDEELIATRRLNGLDDNLYKEETMTEEAFNELIDNFEVVAHLTPYGRKAIKENVKRLQVRIKELEKENYIQKIELTENSIPVQKVKDKLKEVIRLREKTITSEGYNIANGEAVVLQELLEEK